MQVKYNSESAIPSTFIKLSFVIKIFILSIFEWPFYTRFGVVATSMYFVSLICQVFHFHVPGFV